MLMIVLVDTLRMGFLLPLKLFIIHISASVHKCISAGRAGVDICMKPGWCSRMWVLHHVFDALRALTSEYSNQEIYHCIIIIIIIIIIIHQIIIIVL